MTTINFENGDSIRMKTCLTEFFPELNTGKKSKDKIMSVCPCCGEKTLEVGFNKYYLVYDKMICFNNNCEHREIGVMDYFFFSNNLNPDNENSIVELYNYLQQKNLSEEYNFWYRRKFPIIDIKDKKGEITGYSFNPQDAALTIVRERPIITFAISNKIPQFFMYEGGTYVRAQKFINDSINNMTVLNKYKNITMTNNKFIETRKHIERLTVIEKRDTLHSGDVKYINFKNGLFNTETKKLETHDPKIIITNNIPHNYPKGNVRSTIAEKFFIETFGREMELAQMMVGYIFMRNCDAKKCFYF